MLTRLKLLTAGESHGSALTGILDGVPAGVPLTKQEFALQLKRRRHGHGRSPRQQLEVDDVVVAGGVRYGKTTGAPVAVRIDNHEAARWANTLSPWPVDEPAAKNTVPRPGHADRAGMLKLGHDDVRDVLERASARETAMRVALSVVCRSILQECGVVVGSHVVQIGSARSDRPIVDVAADSLRADSSPVRCLDADGEARMVALIDDAAKRGETLGGAFVVVVRGLPIGLGSFTQWDRRLNARLGAALLSIHSVKSVGFGDGAALAATPGTQAHDAFVVDAVQDGRSGTRRPRRSSNHAGGLEGGMSNGEDVVVEVVCKALSTVPGGLPSVDTATGLAARGLVERSDVCAVPSASIVGEAMACVLLCDALLEKFGGDSLEQLRAHITASGHYA
ncbi:MAG: chorismate synthase [Deltaproteobacteria bacterium]|nr:chorismate synthase [Deltaproteobacteria bacterium]